MQQELDMNSNDINNARVVNTGSLTIGGVGVVPGTDTVTVPTASSIPNVPAGDIAATTVQDAIDELDTEKVGIAGTETITGDKTLSGTTVISGATTISGVTTLSGATTTISGSTTISGTLAASEDVTLAKTLIQVKGSDVASASALTLGDGNYFDVTGTASITSITTKGIGAVVKLHFDASLTIAHHATDLVLPGGTNILTSAGDELEFVEYATGDWRLTTSSSGSRFRGVLVTDAGQSIATATHTKINFSSEEYDTDTIHDNATNNTRLTVPTGVTYVRFTAHGRYGADGTPANSGRSISLYKNGVSLDGISDWASIDTYDLGEGMNFSSPVLAVVATDYFELNAWQNSGGALTLSDIWFSMEVIE